MKRSLFTFALMMIYIGINAAPDNFTVKRPAWSKLAGGDQVIIHKSPSSYSPKLVYNWETMVYMNPYTSAKWSSSRLAENEDYLYMSDMSPILSEKNGWYEILDLDLDLNQDGKNDCCWVDSSSCGAITPIRISVGRSNSENFQWVDSPGDPAGGNYALYLSIGQWPEYGTIYVGREIDGMVVCPYSISYNTEDGVITFGDFKFECKSNQVNEDGVPVLSKLSYKMLNTIFTGSEKTNYPIVVYITPAGGEYKHAPYVE